jgi:hypothetical protein
MPTTWSITVDLSTTEDAEGEHQLTVAHARLAPPGGTALEGFGRARRNPSDEDVTEIGNELAAARALRDLADRLLNATSDDLSAIEHHRVRIGR